MLQKFSTSVHYKILGEFQITYGHHTTHSNNGERGEIAANFEILKELVAVGSQKMFRHFEDNSSFRHS